jgi:phospholipid-transporting ATPase
MTNKLIGLTLLTQLILALIAATIGAQWNLGNGLKALYMGNETLGEDDTHGFGYYLIKQTGTWILIFTNFVPISLMVTLELVKFWQGMFMSTDYMMFDEEQDMEMRAQSSNLNEELGQIEYVFSDKTGTLTCNVMEFKKFAAGLLPYGTGQKVETP